MLIAWKNENLYAYYKDAKIGKLVYCLGKLKLTPIAISKNCIYNINFDFNYDFIMIARYLLSTESKKGLFLVYDTSHDTYQEIKFRSPSWISSPSIVAWVSDDGNTCILYEVDGISLIINIR